MPDVPEPEHLHAGLTVRGSQPLIGIPVLEGSEEVVQYFTSEEEADRFLSQHQAGTRRVPGAVSAWEQLDAEDGPDPLDELDRLRRQSTPTPAFEP